MVDFGGVVFSVESVTSIVSQSKLGVVYV